MYVFLHIVEHKALSSLYSWSCEYRHKVLAV